MSIKILALVMPLSGLYAAGFSQASLNLTFIDEKLETVIEYLERHSEYTFVYRTGLFDDIRIQNVRLTDATFTQALDAVLHGKGFGYHITDGNTVVVRREAESSQQQARTLVITGTVKTAKGSPVAGASVFLKGNSRIGTISDAQGKYRLDLTGINKPVINVTFLGMKTYEFTPSAQGEYHIVLEEKISDISEVTITVNTGYMNINKDRMTGAYATLDKELDNTNFMSLDQALEGRVAGLYSVTPNGAPGARAEIRIRGDNSISGNKEPLWVVDGLPLQQGVAPIQDLTHGDIQQSILSHGVGNLAPSDIESVTILKDAAATAIYGARAANGVIVVKTKRGGEGPVSVSYQGHFALVEAPKLNDAGFMNAAEKVAFEIDLMEEFQQRDQNNGKVSRLWDEWKRGVITDAEYNARIAELSSVDVDWFDEIYRMSFSQSHHISMRAGTDKFWFYGSLSASDEKGALKTNRYNTFGTNLKVGFRPHKKIIVDFDIYGSYRESNDHNSAVDPFNYAVFANPYEKAYNEDGSYASDNTWLNDKSLLSIGFRYPNFNILRELEETFNKQKASDVTASLSLGWDLARTLRADIFGRAGYATNKGEKGAGPGTYTSLINYWSKMPFGGGSFVEIPDEFNQGYMVSTEGNSISFSFRASLAYNESFNDKHHVSLFAGTEIASSESWSSRLKLAQYDPDYYFGTFPDYSWNIPLDRVIQSDIANMTTFSYGNINRTASFFSAMTYSYDDRYVFNFNARFDGAGTIDPKNRFTPLWSVSARWNLHNEHIIKDNLPFISELAVRGVFGYTGNIDHRALPYSWIILSGYKYANRYMASQIYFPNPSIKWEKKLDRNIGIDFSFFNNVFGGSFNYYNNITKDLLGAAKSPPSFGNPRLVMNGHDLSNKGWDLNLNLRVKISESFRWITSFNIAQNENRVKNSDMADPTDYNNPNIANKWAGFTASNIEKYPTGTTFGYRFAGVNPDNGEAMFYLSEIARKAYAEANDIPLEDVPTTWEMNNRSVSGLDSNTWFMMSMTDIGRDQPEYYGGFMNTFQWKNFELRTSFSYAVGHSIRTFDGRNFTFSSNDTSMSEMNGLRINVLKSTTNRWRVPGDLTDTPRFTKASSAYYMMNSDDRFQDGDYLNFQEISLNYNFNPQLLKGIGIEYLRIGLQATNIAVFTKAQSTDITTGKAFGYPRTRKFILNLQLTF